MLSWRRFSIDGHVYVFLVVTCLGATGLFGLAPALHVSSTGNSTLEDGGRGTTGGLRARRYTHALVAGQIALTVALLAGAGLLVRSILVLYRDGSVVDSSNLITMQVALGTEKYGQPADRKEFIREVDERLSATGAFSSVTVASDIPMMTVINGQRQLAIEGRTIAADDRPPTVAYLYIGPRYWETLRLRLIRGRDFTPDDGAPGREAVIVNERFVRLFLPNSDPLGQRIQLTNVAAPNAPRPWFTIVGVAPTVPQMIFLGAPEPVVYAAVRGEPAPHRFVSIIARAEDDRAAVVSMLRRAVQDVDHDLPGYYLRTLDELLVTGRWRQSTLGFAFALLAGIALLLASLGVYAVTAYGVSQRRQEIGVRVALGAQTEHIVWLFTRRAVLEMVVGLLAGLAGAIVVGRLLEPILVRTAPTDPLTFAITGAVLIATTLVATILPARRATKIDPLLALRAD
ncbi:MAG: FtsX-like permease family protein [Vicinamibacterales bacterium]